MAGGVMIVGPDEAAAGFLAKLLQSEGIDAVTVQAADAAAQVLMTGPRLVLIDRDVEIVRSIRSLADPKRAEVEIVLLGTEGEDGSAADLGVDHLLPRPIADRTLLTGIRRILASG